MSGLRPCFSVQQGCWWLWSCWSGPCGAARGAEGDEWWDLSAVCAGGEPLLPPAPNQMTKKDFVELAKSTEQMPTLTSGTD